MKEQKHLDIPPPPIFSIQRVQPMAKTSSAEFLPIWWHCTTNYPLPEKAHQHEEQKKGEQPWSTEEEQAAKQDQDTPREDLNLQIRRGKGCWQCGKEGQIMPQADRESR